MSVLVHTPVTKKTWDDIVHAIKAHDQRRGLVLGDIVSHYEGEDLDDEPVEVTIWHNLGRAAVRYLDGESRWGDWDEMEQTILLDGSEETDRRRKLDRYGRQLSA
jgi:hypothetical protein